MDREKKDLRLFVRIRPELKDKLRRAAMRDDRTLCDMVHFILLNHFNGEQNAKHQ